jgi:enoyl-CoA hydratase/carnithine racemase
MNDLRVDTRGEIAVLALRRGKVNALDPSLVENLRRELSRLADDDSVRAMILTGSGSFFSFGFDIPELLPYSKTEFGAFLTEFTDLYTELFLFPKPAIAALNGHTIAGGCMLALACDQRLMADDRGKISLNEITFGSSVFAGSVEMLVSCVGQRNAAEVLYSGAMLTAQKAHRLGLVDRVTGSEELLDESRSVASQLAAADPIAFTSMKKLLREPIAERMREREGPSIREFIDIWYSEATRSRLREIKIR